MSMRNKKITIYLIYIYYDRDNRVNHTLNLKTLINSYLIIQRYDKLYLIFVGY